MVAVAVLPPEVTALGCAQPAATSTAANVHATITDAVRFRIAQVGTSTIVAFR